MIFLLHLSVAVGSTPMETNEALEIYPLVQIAQR
jgi:hypothetical protein